MAVIVVASPKGGAGKTTSAVLLGTEYAHGGLEVVMIDCDPNRCLSIWAERSPLPKNIKLLDDVSERTIIRDIAAIDGDGRVVIVDLQGSASRMMSRAVSQADLVLTPMCATALDAEIGSLALALVVEEEEHIGRHIEQAVVLTRTRPGPVQSRAHKVIEKTLRDHDVPIVEPSLTERSAYASLFQYGGDLYSMPPQGNMEQALANARGFAQAVFKVLTNGIRSSENYRR